MSGKLNYDRGRMQDLSHKHGTAYMDMEPERPPNPYRNDLLGGVAIPGCTCGKRVGFSTPHGKSCPLGKGAIRQAAPQPPKNTTRPAGAPRAETIQTFMQFADCVYEVGELPSLTQWLKELLIRMSKHTAFDNDARLKLNKIAAELFKVERLMRPPQFPGSPASQSPARSLPASQTQRKKRGKNKNKSRVKVT